MYLRKKKGGGERERNMYLLIEYSFHRYVSPYQKILTIADHSMRKMSVYGTLAWRNRMEKSLLKREKTGPGHIFVKQTRHRE